MPSRTAGHGHSRWRSGKESPSNARDLSLNSWPGKIPQGGNGQPIRVFWPGEPRTVGSPGWRSAQGCKELDRTEHVHTHGSFLPTHSVCLCSRLVIPTKRGTASHAQRSFQPPPRPCPCAAVIWLATDQQSPSCLLCLFYSPCFAFSLLAPLLLSLPQLESPESSLCHTTWDGHGHIIDTTVRQLRDENLLCHTLRVM